MSSDAPAEIKLRNGVTLTTKRPRKRNVIDDSNKENVDPLAIVKPKRTRAVGVPKEPKAPKPPKEPRVKKEKPIPRVLDVDDHEGKETFTIPAEFACSSCKKPHSISEHLVALPTPKVFQTCCDCRAKGVEFYRRQKRIVSPLDVVQEAEGCSDGTVNARGEIPEAE